MPSPKAVVVAGFQIPAESTLRAGPEHKVQRGLAAGCVRRDAVSSCVNPHRANAGHKLHFLGQRPGLLEQKIGIPFRRMTAEGRRDARLNLQPVLYRRNFNGDSRAEAPSRACEAPARSAPDLCNCGRFLLAARLREGAPRAKKKQHDRQRSYRSPAAPDFHRTMVSIHRTACRHLFRVPLRPGSSPIPMPHDYRENGNRPKSRCASHPDAA